MKYVLGCLLALCLCTPLCAADSVDINTADAETIAATLNGVGMSKAQAIVDYRETNGRFKHPDELVNVKGIGLATVDKNRELIKLGKKKEVTSQ